SGVVGTGSKVGIVGAPIASDFGSHTGSVWSMDVDTVAGTASGGSNYGDADDAHLGASLAMSDDRFKLIIGEPGFQRAYVLEIDLSADSRGVIRRVPPRLCSPR